MIELEVKLLRDPAIYLAGELVECFIEFTNKLASEVRDSDIDCQENLAWASIQIHCYRKTSYKVKSNDKVSELAEKIAKTSLDAATQTPGDVIIETKPKILFCDLKLDPGETKKYFFNETIPRDGPPTYRGQDIRYFYKLTIATQRVKSKVQTLTVPISVFTIPVIMRPDDQHCTEEDLAPVNPFLEKREISELEISWDNVKQLTARRSPKHYRISNKHGFVGKFCLYKPNYKLGEDIVGSLDFSDCEVRCVQYSVKLQSLEVCLQNDDTQQQTDINDGASSVNSFDLASISSGNAYDTLHKSSASSSSKDKESDEQTGKISTHSIVHEFSYSLIQTYIIVPIPLHVTPTFRTNLVDVKWRLHFEFVTTTLMDFGRPNPIVGEIAAPAEIPVETMMWDLPVTLYATNPLQIPSLNQTFTLLIK